MSGGGGSLPLHQSAADVTESDFNLVSDLAAGVDESARSAQVSPVIPRHSLTEPSFRVTEPPVKSTASAGEALFEEDPARIGSGASPEA